MKDERTGNTSGSNFGTDWEKLRAMTDADIRAGIESDNDAMPTDGAFWESAQVVLPRRKETVTMRIDASVLAWFQRQNDYQMCIDAALQGYMKAHGG
ncbi:MAG: Uncharacterized conserved protein, DUF4415 family [Candidatus Kentron sp. G]|nr:MAG: Uncharacterized conserved protein, DUF4415 family [Candidatus Kentron sp. G]VFM98226.1 MAG: Uncharacterized conserved protein, DUF4415 family [Candidatus Kentron sp. G]VFN04978.1 MAG: Uncharacterized conserved protein, DUF4415 family [Candidatus Kentron sp. G]